MSAPSGQQFVIEGGGYRAVVTQGGGALRELTREGRALIEGFAEDAVPDGGRGQLLMPWPNRIRDGRYEHEGRIQQLALTEPSRGNASHGLVRWASWSLVQHERDLLTLGYFLPAQTGYPWALELSITYALDEHGLRVTQAATNVSPTAAPYASGAHPYLVAGPGPCDDWELTLPAATRLLTDDERLLPTGREAVAGTASDFRAARRIGSTVVNDAFTDLARDADARSTVVLRGEHAATALWVDRHHGWLQVYTGEDTRTPRAAVAVEPMTAPPDAFNSREDLTLIAPGATFAASWGIQAL